MNGQDSVDTYHRVGKGGWDGDYHPPYQTPQEVPGLAPYQTRDKSAIQLGDIQTDQSPEHEEHAMTDQQAQLFALPARYAYFEQSDQIPKELSVQLHLLSTICSGLIAPKTWPLPCLGQALCSGLLLIDCGTDPADKGEK